MVGSGAVSDEGWKKQLSIQKLDGEIQQLKVALSELNTLKPMKTTYTKKANAFFLEKHDVIAKAKSSMLKELEENRYGIGLELRDIAQ
ncbi:uncharacterized protein PHALS_06455 [Plasmopara halstedii]|uniref:Prefoldin n=1 Tax=Plasmopara halstedii TaxID=4781 RepID=A0A0N7L819_PLAHL|nr:uncharacterized protein PHALS_06455 [Plasmopara halstedii]CEG48643.1 hypothetical protein PHALS_06455 [Plasmopara halstedii]|eukprot:XP_024585012.1 hypothetical protein PHALS_06455 [Plasmopara halstedii]